MRTALVWYAIFLYICISLVIIKQTIMTYTIYDNHNINYTEWFEKFKEYCQDNDIDATPYDEYSDKFHQWIYDTLSMEWDDMLLNLKYDKNNNVDCVVTGTLGLWDGRHNIDTKHFPTLEKAIYACITNCEYIVITEEEGVINVTATHHDGTNYFEIHKLNAKGYDAYCESDNDLNNEKYFDKFVIEW